MAEPVQVYTIFDPPPKVTVDCSDDVDWAQQQFKEEADINQIMARALAGLPLSPDQVNTRAAVFGDVSAIGDFQTVSDLLVAAQAGFDSLSAKVRDRFQNDPALLLRFLQDVDNREEAVKLGLVNPPAPSEPSAGAGPLTVGASGGVVLTPESPKA